MAADLLARVRALYGCNPRAEYVDAAGKYHPRHVLAASHVRRCDACARIVVGAVLEEAACLATRHGEPCVSDAIRALKEKP